MAEGDLKRALSRVYNQVNSDIFGRGVTKQIIDLLPDKIVITIFHPRIPMMATLDRHFPQTALEVDLLLGAAFRRQLHNALNDELDLQVKCVLHNYSAEDGVSVTVILLETE